MQSLDQVPLHPADVGVEPSDEAVTRVFRPQVFTHLAPASEVGDIDIRERGGARFFFNCNNPSDGKILFGQSLNLQQAMVPDLRFALDVDLVNNGYGWASLEYHLPLAVLEGHGKGRFLVLLRAEQRDTVSLGYGGILNNGRGFECFELQDIAIGGQTKLITLEIEFEALPLDEIENDLFVLALYLTKTGTNRLSILDLALEVF